jgi:protein-S-isoprenylcysteine O-methyltransferase Ste14
MKNPYYLFLAIFVCGVLTRNLYEILKKAGRVDLESKLQFASIFSVMMALWISWFLMCPLDPYRLELPDGLRWIGLAGVILGWCLALLAFKQLHGVENIKHLITTGIFAKFRHPMYTGFMLWILGWSLFNGAVQSFIAGLLGLGSVLWWRLLEETELVKHYGEQYREYRSRTWF